MALISKWVQTTAIIESLDETLAYDESFTEKQYRPVVKYNVDGVEYISKDSEYYDDVELNCKVGDVMQIVYDPDNPKHFAFLGDQKSKARKQRTKLIFWGIIILIIVWLKLIF